MHPIITDALPLVGSPGVLLLLGYLIWRVRRLEHVMVKLKAEALLAAVRIRRLEKKNGLSHPTLDPFSDFFTPPPNPTPRHR